MKAVAFVLAILIIGDCSSKTTTCGGNCPSNTCLSCPCGTTQNTISTSTWCSKYSNWSQSCCNCIMSHESAANSNALNNNTDGSVDVGLWQINTVNWAVCSSSLPPCDLTTNLNCAIQVWKWGSNTWKFWSTCSACGCCGTA